MAKTFEPFFAWAIHLMNNPSKRDKGVFLQYREGVSVEDVAGQVTKSLGIDEGSSGPGEQDKDDQDGNG